MQIPEQWIKPFPAYEDVFYDQLEQHRLHFLPLCSINLQCMEQGRDEWVHIVSVKEIYDGCVGESTREFHNRWTKEDMLAFDVIDGKYRFAADWNYFRRHQELAEAALRQKAADDGELAEPYKANEADYASRKAYYEQTGSLFPYSSFGRAMRSDEEVLQHFKQKQESGWGLSYPEINGMLDDVAFKSERMQSWIEQEGETIEELQKFGQTNLFHVPKKDNGEVFPYIAALTGYYFQAYGADTVYLFYEKPLAKAVICFEYT